MKARKDHCIISTATTYIGSSCVCSTVLSNLSRPISCGQPVGANHTTVQRCRHFGGEVVIYSTNGHLVFIILRAFNE